MESEITIKGVTASLGQVDGEIFIVKSFEDLVKFKEGAILVSITTDPSYTLIMGKCKGIITAIGGIASHAAIIAREAGLPCIVGIGEKEIQKLQTGDKIFMDANSGTIYKKENKIDLFTEGLLKTMARLKGKEYWPFSPIQILSYYESEVIKHFYKRFYELKDKGYSDKQIADLFENTDMIIDFLFNFACVSFKVAHEFTDFKTEIYEREKFFNDFFKIIKLKDSNFLTKPLERKYFEYDKINEILNYDFFNTKEEKIFMTFSAFKIAQFYYNWAIYYDLFAAYGSTSHGPYEITYKDEQEKLFIDEFYNQKPLEIWEHTKECSVKKISICRIFENDTKYDMDISGRLRIMDDVKKKLKYILIIADGKVLTLEEIEQLTTKLNELSIKQYKYVQELDDLEKIKKAIHITYYVYKDFFGEEWKELMNESLKNVDFFKEKFIEDYKDDPLSKLDKEKLKEMLYPLNNILHT